MLSSMQTSSIIWITGGGSGIGKAAAVAMARQGTQIVVSGRRPAELEAAVAAVNAAGGSAEAHPLDVSDADAVARVADSILSRHGRVDTLINSAGTNVPKRAWDSISMSDFRHVVDVNLNGAFNCISTVLPGMRANRPRDDHQHFVMGRVLPHAADRPSLQRQQARDDRHDRVAQYGRVPSTASAPA